MTTPLALLLAAWAGTQQPAGQWRLVEEWRVGGAVDGPHSFGDVRGMGVQPNGGIVLIDARDQQVHFFDSKGQPVRTVGRKGAGPGEFQRANGLLVSSTGQVLVNDPGNNRFTLLARNGDLVKTFPILNPWGYGYLWDALYSTGDLLDEYVPIHKPANPEAIAARRIWSADFSRADTIMPALCSDAPRRNPEDFFYSFRSARGGRTMSIPWASPRIEVVRGGDGTRWRADSPITRPLSGSPRANATRRLRSAFGAPGSRSPPGCGIR
jgi:hypothetical protein